MFYQRTVAEKKPPAPPRMADSAVVSGGVCPSAATCVPSLDRYIRFKIPFIENNTEFSSSALLKAGVTPFQSANMPSCFNIWWWLCGGTS